MTTQSADRLFIETALNYQRHGTSYPHSAAVERIAEIMARHPESIEQELQLAELIEQHNQMRRSP